MLTVYVLSTTEVVGYDGLSRARSDIVEVRSLEQARLNSPAPGSRAARSR